MVIVNVVAKCLGIVLSLVVNYGDLRIYCHDFPEIYLFVPSNSLFFIDRPPVICVLTSGPVILYSGTRLGYLTLQGFPWASVHRETLETSFPTLPNPLAQ